MADRISFEELAARLSPEAKRLFREMTALHMRASGDRFFIESRTFGGTRLHFVGEGARGSLTDVDGAALHDLAQFSIVQLSHTPRGTANYRISGDGQRFYQYLLELEGAAPTQVEDEVTRTVHGDEFARAHPSAAHHLREAFSLLWSGDTGNETISELGDHLRNALFDLVGDLVGEDGARSEEPIKRLERWIEDRGMQRRERAVLAALVELARSTLWLDQRLTHVRDELDRSEPAPTWDEVRRAAFTTATVCYELSRC